MDERTTAPRGQRLFPVRVKGMNHWLEVPGTTAQDAAKAYVQTLEAVGVKLPVVIEVSLGIDGYKRFRVDHVSFYRAQEGRG